MAMRKPSAEVKLVSALLFLYPLFVLFWSFLLMSAWKIPRGKMEIFNWVGFFVLFGVLGYGVLRLSWKMRLAAIVFSVSGVVGPPLGIIIAPLMNFNVFLKALEMHGAFVVVWQPLLILFKIFGISIVYQCFIVYKLTRPRIKVQFQR